jgi:hypothetical protein
MDSSRSGGSWWARPLTLRCAVDSGPRGADGDDSNPRGARGPSAARVPDPPSSKNAIEDAEALPSPSSGVESRASAVHAERPARLGGAAEDRERPCLVPAQPRGVLTTRGEAMSFGEAAVGPELDGGGDQEQDRQCDESTRECDESTRETSWPSGPPRMGRNRPFPARHHALAAPRRSVAVPQPRRRLRARRHAAHRPRSTAAARLCRSSRGARGAAARDDGEEPGRPALRGRRPAGCSVIAGAGISRYARRYEREGRRRENVAATPCS